MERPFVMTWAISEFNEIVAFFDKEFPKLTGD